MSIIIAQNAMSHSCRVYSLDKHFDKMSKLFPLNTF